MSAGQPAPPDAALAERFEVRQEFSGGEGWSALVQLRDGGAQVVLKVLESGCNLIEGSLLASLQHPAIPSVLEVGNTADGRAYLVRDYAPGRPLSELLPLPADAARDLAAEILGVLAYVHLRGILHLDLKPANIVRDEEGRYRLLDFGLGSRAGDAGRGGTPFFAPPEVLLGSRPDVRSDLFSLGAVLVAALWERAKGPPLSRFLQRFPTCDFFDACGVDAGDFPAPFDALLPRLLSRRPGRRFGDAQAALEFLASGSGRPELSLLRPDPIALHGSQLAPVLEELGEGGLELVGGTDEDRRQLALFAACSLGSVRSIEMRDDGARLGRGAADIERRWFIPPLTAEVVHDHLMAVLGLDRGAAEKASLWLFARCAPTAAALGECLAEQVEAGAIQPDGSRWSWPDAAAGRLRDEPIAQPAATAETVRRAARRGRVELALALFQRAAAGTTSDAERILRRQLALGFLEGGEAMRTVPLTYDLPVEHLQALFDSGRTAEARRRFPHVATDTGDPDPGAERRVQRVAAQLAFEAGDRDDALRRIRALTENDGSVQEWITLGAILEGTGSLDEGRDILRQATSELDPSAEPFLRAGALTNLAHIERRLGNLEDSRAMHAEARELFFNVGHTRHAATAATNLGVLEKDLGLWPDAVTHLRQARALYRHLGNDTGEAIAEANLGIVALESGDAAAAVRRLQDAERRLARLGSGRAAILATAMLARAQAELGHGEAARATLARVDPGDDPRLRAEVDRVRDMLEEAAAHPESAAERPEPPKPSPPTQSVTEDRGINPELFRTFLAVNRRLASESDLERAMDYLLDAAVTLSGGRQGYLLLARPDGLRMEFQAGDSGPAGKGFSRSLANRAMQEQRTLTGEDALADRDLADMPSIRNLQVRSAVCAPFQSASGATGAIYVEHQGRAGVFSDRDKEHLEILGDQAAIAVDRMLREEQLANELQHSRRELAVAKRAARRQPTRIVGKSRQMAELRRQIEKLAGLDLSVLILGETGTGKELVARAIHESGPRGRGPFVAENCSALPGELMERELFGHVEGAFTGADRDRPGLLELAHGGTLFLDEVGDMPLSLQAKLLRALQEQAIRPVGGSETVRLDLRLLAATHRDLRAMIAAGEFREDLFFRLAAVELRVPPLRERAGDVEVLTRHFLDRFNRDNRANRTLTESAQSALGAYSWPGNVRELEHVVARACLLAESDAVSDLLLPEVAPRAEAPESGGVPGPAGWPVITLKEAERRTIAAALESTGGEKSKAARTLGISRTALYEKLKRMAKE